MVCAAKVFWDITQIYYTVGYKAMGMKLLREEMEIQKEVETTLRITDILGLGRRKVVAEKLKKDQRLE